MKARKLVAVAALAGCTVLGTAGTAGALVLPIGTPTLPVQTPTADDAMATANAIQVTLRNLLDIQVTAPSANDITSQVPSADDVARRLPPVSAPTAPLPTADEVANRLPSLPAKPPVAVPDTTTIDPGDVTSQVPEVPSSDAAIFLLQVTVGAAAHDAEDLARTNAGDTTDAVDGVLAMVGLSVGDGFTAFHATMAQVWAAARQV